MTLSVKDSFSKIKSKRGFTLMELLIVIALIAILIAIGASSYSQAQKKARNSKRQSDINKIALSLEEYFSDHHDYPTKLSCLTGSDITCEAPNDKVYVTIVPRDPLTSNAYDYQPGTNVDKTGGFTYESYKLQTTNDTNSEGYSYSISKPD